MRSILKPDAGVCFPKKKGPNTVRSRANLRPISIVRDLAAISDGLLMNRARDDLACYWGPTQFGGVSEALACVVTVVLLCQLRIALDLDTYLPFGDIIAAFDCAPRAEMLAGIFDAGVQGNHWMLFDDGILIGLSEIVVF